MADQTNRVRNLGNPIIEGPEDDAARLTRYKLNITDDADVMDDQRDKAQEDCVFIHETGGMWRDFQEPEFTDRAKMEFDLVSNFVYRFIGEWNMNRQGVEFRPDNGVTDDDDAELMNGIFRADFRDGSGKISLDNAVYEVATCGIGALKLAGVMEDEGDPENDDQRIEFRPINNAYNAVYWDYTAERIDKRDARWVTMLTRFSMSSFLEAYPDQDPTSAYVPENLRDIENTGSFRERSIYIATRYEVAREKETVFIYSNLVSGQEEVFTEEQHEEVKAQLKADETMLFEREREIVKQTVHKWVFSGSKMLEGKKRIAGEWLPIIPFYGYRMYVNGSEWYKGLVRNLKDACRLFNMLMNQTAENAASNGQAIPIVAPEQVENKDIETAWSDRNNKPYLPLDPITDQDGNAVHQGVLGYLQAGQLDPNVQVSMESVTNFIKETTGGVPQDALDPNASGKAIRAVIKRMNLNTQPVQDNINTGIEAMGRVYGSMASDIYTRQSIVRTLGEDGTEGREQLLSTVVDDDGNFIETNNLRGKKFRVYADVGPQYESLREESIENLKGVADFAKDMPGGQQYSQVILSAIMENMEGVGLKAVKDLNRKIMLLSGSRDPETDEDKKILAEAQQSANQPGPQDEFLRAAAKEAEAKARKQDTGAVKDVADAQKTAAETAEIKARIPQDAAKTLAQLRKEAFEQAESLPFGPS